MNCQVFAHLFQQSHWFQQIRVKSPTNGFLQTFVPSLRKGIGLLIVIIALCSWHAYHVNKYRVREKARECHNHKPQPFPDTKRKRKQTKPNKHKSNKHTKSIKTSSLFPKQGNRNAKRTEKHRNKITQGKT